MLVGGVVGPAGRLGAPWALSARMIHLAGLARRSLGILYLQDAVAVALFGPFVPSESPENLAFTMLVGWGKG